MMGQLQGKTQILDRPEITTKFAEKRYKIDHLEPAGIIN
jgi:hypothetical protein